MLGWIGDVGVVVTSTGPTPTGGARHRPDGHGQGRAGADAACGTSRRWPAGRASVTVRDEPYGDGTITTFDFGDLGTLFGAGHAGGWREPPGLPISGHVELSFTVQRGVAVIGVGPDFVKSVVDARAGASLADQPRYRSVGEPARRPADTGLDLAAIGSLATAAGRQQCRSSRQLASARCDRTSAAYLRRPRPYLAPFDVAAAGIATGDGSTAGTFILTVTKP